MLHHTPVFEYRSAQDPTPVSPGVGVCLRGTWRDRKREETIMDRLYLGITITGTYTLVAVAMILAFMQ